MIDLNQLFVYVNHAQSNGDRVRGQVASMRGRLNGIVSSNAMMGRTKEQINRLITSQQIPLLQGLENVYWKMFVKSNQAVNEFMSAMAENEENAIFNHDSLVELECDITDANDEVLDLNVEYQRIYCSIAGDLSLPMPSTGAYESNYEQARKSLRNTRECLEGFSFDYDEIRELMGEIVTYVGMLEGASDLPIHSAARVGLFGGSDFAQRMGNMHTEFAAAEQAKIDRMVASWEGMHYSDIIASMPEPMTQAEKDAFIDFLGGMCNDFQTAMVEYLQSIEKLLLSPITAFTSLTPRKVLLSTIKELPGAIGFGFTELGENLPRTLFNNMQSEVLEKNARIGNNEKLRRVNNRVRNKVNKIIDPNKAKKAARLGKGLNNFGKFVGVLGAGYTAITDFSRRRAEGQGVVEAGLGASATAGGGFGGSKVGGKIGAKKGAKLGLVLGPKGAVVGAVVGGLVGAFIGSNVGSKVAGAVSDTVVAGARVAKEGVRQIGRAIGGLFRR